MKVKHISLYNVLMCFGVVFIHLTSTPVIYLRHDSIWYFIFFAINKFLSFAVPSFIFLSGFKLFCKYRSAPLQLGKFYSGRVKRIVIPYLIAFFIYFLFYRTQNLIQWNELIPGLLLGTPAAHFYYIIIAIQFYLLFPLISLIFKKDDKLLLCISFICTIVFNYFISFNYSDRFFAAYIFYFILGMFIAKHKPESEIMPPRLLSAVFLLFAVIHICLSYKMSLGNYWYKISEIGQVLYSALAIISVYNLCIKNADNKHADRFIDFIGPNTFNIFLYHILVMNIMQFIVYPHFNLSVKYQFIISTVVVIGTIIAYCFLSNRIKKNNHEL